MVETRYKINERVKNGFNSIKAKLITIATLLYINSSRFLITVVMPAMAKGKAKKPAGGATTTGGGGGGGKGSVYNPSAPSVNGKGTVTLNGDGTNVFDKTADAIGKLQPTIGIVIAFIGVLSILVAIWYSSKAGRDISKADSTGWNRAGMAVAGAVVTGILMIVGGIAMSAGLLGGQSIFGK